MKRTLGGSPDPAATPTEGLPDSLRPSVGPNAALRWYVRSSTMKHTLHSSSPCCWRRQLWGPRFPSPMPTCAADSRPTTGPAAWPRCRR